MDEDRSKYPFNILPLVRCDFLVLRHLMCSFTGLAEACIIDLKISLHVFTSLGTMHLILVGRFNYLYAEQLLKKIRKGNCGSIYKLDIAGNLKRFSVRLFLFLISEIRLKYRFY